jgi:hypothetical protein
MNNVAYPPQHVTFVCARQAGRSVHNRKINAYGTVCHKQNDISAKDTENRKGDT